MKRSLWTLTLVALFGVMAVPAQAGSWDTTIVEYDALHTQAIFTDAGRIDVPGVWSMYRRTDRKTVGDVTFRKMHIEGRFRSLDGTITGHMISNHNYRTPADAGSAFTITQVSPQVFHREGEGLIGHSMSLLHTTYDANGDLVSSHIVSEWR